MGIIANKLHESLKLLNLHPASYVLLQKAEVLKTCCIVRMFLARQLIRYAWQVRPILFEKQRNRCEVREVNDCDDDDDILAIECMWG